MRILIGTPVAKTVEERYAHSLFGLCKYETARGNDIDLVLERGPRIHHNRNQIAHQFLAGDYEWLFQIDMDVAVPMDALQRFLGRKKDVVFGMYVLMMNTVPHASFYMMKDNGRYTPTGKFGDGLIEIDAGGTGLCLTHRKVVEAVEKLDYGETFPWFDLTPTKGGWYSEDFTFCQRIKEAGYKIYGDCDVESGHIKDAFYGNKGLTNTKGDTT